MTYALFFVHLPCSEAVDRPVVRRDDGSPGEDAQPLHRRLQRRLAAHGADLDGFHQLRRTRRRTGRGQMRRLRSEALTREGRRTVLVETCVCWDEVGTELTCSDSGDSEYL